MSWSFLDDTLFESVAFERKSRFSSILSSSLSSLAIVYMRHSTATDEFKSSFSRNFVWILPRFEMSLIIWFILDTSSFVKSCSYSGEHQRQLFPPTPQSSFRNCSTTTGVPLLLPWVRRAPRMAKSSSLSLLRGFPPGCFFHSSSSLQLSI